MKVSFGTENGALYREWTVRWKNWDVMSQKDHWVNLYRVQTKKKEKIKRVSNRTERKRSGVRGRKSATREVGASSEFQRAQLWHIHLNVRVQMCAILHEHTRTLNLVRSSSLRWLYEILLSFGNLPCRSFGQIDVFLYFPNCTTPRTLHIDYIIAPTGCKISWLLHFN